MKVNLHSVVQGCTNPRYEVAVAAEVCTVAYNIYIFSMNPGLSKISGAQNFEMGSIFLEKKVHPCSRIYVAKEDGW
jgi:hypothetical protein